MDSHFLEVHKASLVHSFWEENYKQVILTQIERMYITEIIKYWCVVDLVMNEDKVLIKWQKRFTPLTENEISEKYGR